VMDVTVLCDLSQSPLFEYTLKTRRNSGALTGLRERWNGSTEKPRGWPRGLNLTKQEASKAGVLDARLCRGTDYH
jgi:hypothetical protein